MDKFNLKGKLSRRTFFKSTAAGSAAAAISVPLALSTTATALAHNGTDTAIYPTGHQYQIRYRNQTATITELGATLRSFMVSGREMLFTFGRDEPVNYARGQVLHPYPNRIRDGKYVFQGNTYQFPINEVWSGNSIHGLTRWVNWSVIQHCDDRLVMGYTLYPQDGYPFMLSIRLTYALTKRGLEVTTTAKNIGKQDLPYGVGYHPYFKVTDTIDTALLHIPAETYFETDARLLPYLPAVSVAGTKYDFRTPRVIGDTTADNCYADVIHDSDGFARVTLSAPAGKPKVTMFMDSTYKFVQIYTSHTLPTADLRGGIVIEPYTCAPDAFNNGIGLIVLKPGEHFTNLWGVTATV